MAQKCDSDIIMKLKSFGISIESDSEQRMNLTKQQKLRDSVSDLCKEMLDEKRKEKSSVGSFSKRDYLMFLRKITKLIENVDYSNREFLAEVIKSVCFEINDNSIKEIPERFSSTLKEMIEKIPPFTS